MDRQSMGPYEERSQGTKAEVGVMAQAYRQADSLQEAGEGVGRWVITNTRLDVNSLPNETCWHCKV